MNLVKRGLIVSVATAGLVVGSAGVASANPHDGHGDDGTNIDDSGNIWISDVVDANLVVNDALNDNVVVLDNLLGGNNFDSR